MVRLPRAFVPVEVFVSTRINVVHLATGDTAGLEVQFQGRPHRRSSPPSIGHCCSGAFSSSNGALRTNAVNVRPRDDYTAQHRARAAFTNGLVEKVFHDLVDPRGGEEEVH